MTIRFGTTIAKQIIDGTNDRTIAHELGHTAGLHHPNEKRNKLQITNRRNNLMTQTRFAAKNDNRHLHVNQLNSIIRSYNNGELNQGYSKSRSMMFSRRWPFITLKNKINF